MEVHSPKRPPAAARNGDDKKAVTATTTTTTCRISFESDVSSSLRRGGIPMRQAAGRGGDSQRGQAASRNTDLRWEAHRVGSPGARCRQGSARVGLKSRGREGSEHRARLQSCRSGHGGFARGARGHCQPSGVPRKRLAVRAASARTRTRPALRRARRCTVAACLELSRRARVRSTRLDPSFPTMYGSGVRIATHFLRISSSTTQVPICVIKIAGAEFRQILLYRSSYSRILV